MKKIWKKVKKSQRTGKTSSSGYADFDDDDCPQNPYGEVQSPRRAPQSQGPRLQGPAGPTAPMADPALDLSLDEGATRRQVTKATKEREGVRSKTGKMAAGDVSSSPSSAQKVRRRKMTLRLEIIKELVQTERDFLTDMELCIREVVKPLREKQVVDVDRLFGNMETVCEVSAALLHMLHQATSVPDPELVLIGDIFIQAKAALEDVYKTYCCHHDDANQSLKTYEKDEEINKHFTTCVLILKTIYGQEGYPNVLDMGCLLAKPVLRVTRYPLLLKELWQTTPEDHPDRRSLLEAFGALAAINVNIDELRRRKVLEDYVEHTRVDTGDALHHLSEMRMVLLGYKGSGKTSLANAIVLQGDSEPRPFSAETTARCETRQADVAGRRVTVVDTPGWWSEDAPSETPDGVKREIVRGTCLCPPGPHALLLVVAAGFAHAAEVYRHMEEHVELLSPTAWRHAMVLFSGGDCLGGGGSSRSIERFIESEGEALRGLVGKCGNRYHVFYSGSGGGDGGARQVADLMVKIEEMVAGNGTGSPAATRTPDTQSKGTAPCVPAPARPDGAPPPSVPLLPGDDLRLSEMRMILMGPRGAGKSSLANTILGSEQFILAPTAQSKKRQADVAGRRVTVVDTPGWFINASLNTSSELTKEHIVRSPSLCHPGPHALLLAMRAGTSFPADWCKNIEDHVQLLGESAWSHAMILFSFGDCLGGRSIEQFIESEGEALQRLVGKCGNRYHVFNNMNRRDGAQVTDLMVKIEEMVAGNEGHRGTGSPATPTPGTQSDGAASSVPESDQVEKLMALLEERERELQNTIAAMEEEGRRKQQKLTQDQRDHAEKVSAEMKEDTIKDIEEKVSRDHAEKLAAQMKADTIKEIDDSTGEQQKLTHSQRDHAEKLSAQMKEEDTTTEMEDGKIPLGTFCPSGDLWVPLGPTFLLTSQMKEKEDDTITAMEESKQHQQKLTRDQREHAEKLTAQMKADTIKGMEDSTREQQKLTRDQTDHTEEEDTIKDMEDSTGDLQKLTRGQRDYAEKLTAQMKEEDTTKETEDSKGHLQKLTRDQWEQAEKLAAQIKEEDTIKDMEDSARDLQKRIQDQREHAEKLLAQMKEEEEETITAMEEKQQQKLTQDQRDHAEKVSAEVKDTVEEMENSSQDHAEKLAAQMKENEDTINPLRPGYISTCKKVNSTFTILIEMEDSTREQQKVTQEQRDHAEKLTAPIKEEVDTIKEMEDSTREQQKVTQDHAEKLAAQIKEKEDTVKEMEDSTREQQKASQDHRDHAEKLAAPIKEEDTIKEMQDSTREQQKVTQDQKDHAEKLAAPIKEEDTIKEMQDSTREQQKVTQDQKDHAEKLAAQIKEEEEDTITAMEESERGEQQKPTQDQRDHAVADVFTVQMKEVKSELEKICQRQMEADEKRVAAGAETRLKSVRKVFVQRISDLILREVLDERPENGIVTDEEMNTAMAEKLSSFMVDVINQLDRNLSGGGAAAEAAAYRLA